MNSIDLLKHLADLYVPIKEPTVHTNHSSTDFDSEQWLQHWWTSNCNEPYQEIKLFNGSVKYKLLDGCAFDRNHKDASVIIHSDGTIGYNCFHDSCKKYGWRDFRTIYEHDAYIKKKGVNN